MIKDIQTSLSMTSEMRKNQQSLYAGDQETIQILNAELHTLKEEVKREKALSNKENELLKFNFERSIELLKKQLANSEGYVGELERRIVEMTDHIEKIEENNELAIKTIKAEAGKKSKVIKDKVEALIAENKKLKEECNELSRLSYSQEDDAIRKYKGLVDRFERMVVSFDEFVSKSKLFNTDKVILNFVLNPIRERTIPKGSAEEG